MFSLLSDPCDERECWAQYLPRPVLLTYLMYVNLGVRACWREHVNYVVRVFYFTRLLGSRGFADGAKQKILREHIILRPYLCVFPFLCGLSTN